MKNSLLTAVLLVALSPIALLADSTTDIQPNDTIGTMLQRNVGQVVELRLKSGEKIGGKIAKLGEKLVLVSQITGAEFYDAVVDTADIAAVVIRSKAK